MKQKNTSKQTSFWDNFQELVYKLIYPALLGSMLYDIFKPTNALDKLFKIGIVLFYLIDYYHLYTYMDKKFTKEEKTTPTYVIFDILVALFLCIAFNATYISKVISLFVNYLPFFYLNLDYYLVSLIFLSSLPFCFAVYTRKLKIKIEICKNEILLWCMHVVFGLIAIVSSVIGLIFCYRLEVFVIVFIFVMIFVYLYLICLEKKYNPLV